MNSGIISNAYRMFYQNVMSLLICIVMTVSLQVEYNQNLIKDVAVKVLSRYDEPNPDNELQRYADNRRELNMIYNLDHLRIVNFYGVLINPVAFVMEWAGHGSLDAIIKQYRSYGCYVCPDSVLAIAYQVKCMVCVCHLM